jgi:hypothetical protein
VSRSKTASAWGVIDHDGLKIRSISDTRRAAIINWLVTDAGQFISTSHDDDHINALWDAEKGEATVAPVCISYVQRS